jgi:hypothetical protein
VLTADLDDLITGRGGALRIPGHDDPVLLPSVTVARILCDTEITTVITQPVTPAGKHPTARATPSETSPSPEAGPGRTDIVGWLRGKAHDVLYVGRARRTVTPRQRRALERRDQHCAFPDCRVDTSRTDAHHVIPWELGGRTDIDNLVLLCNRHHHYVHEGGWTITATVLPPTATGYWAFAPPRPQP